MEAIQPLASRVPYMVRSMTIKAVTTACMYACRLQSAMFTQNVEYTAACYIPVHL